MKRYLVVVLAVLLAFTACKPPNEDAKALANDVTKSANLPRHFVYTQFVPTAFFRVEGTVQDDFRYSVVLSTGDGAPVVQEIASDDALAIRLLRPSFASSISNSLGHPTVDTALRAGKWVLDPSGAPPLIQPNATAGNETTNDPFRDALQSLLYITQSASTAAGVKKFSLEDVTYRPQFDPWRYPTGSEIRYDFARPPLAKSASTNGGGQTIGPNVFRKLSVFVRDSRVERTCENVDIEGHEEIVALKQRGLNSNPYLRDLLRRIEKKQTTTPIVPKVAILDVSYPKSAPVGLPSDAVIGNLATFQSAFLQAFTSGVLKPKPGDKEPRACNRPHAKTI